VLTGAYLDLDRQLLDACGDRHLAGLGGLGHHAEVKVDTKNPERGPRLLISGEKDNTAPHSMAEGTYNKQNRNEGVTESVEMPTAGTRW
jgi:non-heme chloroperoxidase